MKIGILSLFFLLASIGTMAMVPNKISDGLKVSELCSKYGVGSDLKNSINICLVQSNNVISAIKENSPFTEEQLLGFSVLWLATRVGAQNDTAITQCMALLTSASDQLSQCLNNTAILNDILNNTTPDPRINNYSGYVYTVFGAFISLGGFFLTPICDSLTCLAAYIFETRNKARFEKLQQSVDDLKNTSAFSEEEFNTLKDFLCVVGGKLDNNIDEKMAREKIDHLLRGENKIAEVIALLPEVLKLNSTDTSGGLVVEVVKDEEVVKPVEVKKGEEV